MHVLFFLVVVFLSFFGGWGRCWGVAAILLKICFSSKARLALVSLIREKVAIFRDLPKAADKGNKGMVILHHPLLNTPHPPPLIC